VDKGYIRLHRKIRESQIWHNEGLLKVSLYCTLKANWKTKWVPITVGKVSTEVMIERGKFIFGRNTAASELRMKPSTLWKRMRKLENLDFLNIQSNNHYSVVTIVNYDFYNPAVANGEQPKEQPGNSRGTAGEHNEEGLKRFKKKRLYSERFEVFWQAYPRKEGKGKALQRWNEQRCAATTPGVISEGLAKWLDSDKWLREGGKFIPMPATWLNQRRWEDDPMKEKRAWD
jgi:hypothetical protein